MSHTTSEEKSVTYFSPLSGKACNNNFFNVSLDMGINDVFEKNSVSNIYIIEIDIARHHASLLIIIIIRSTVETVR